jgi:hypothetical protein
MLDVASGPVGDGTLRVRDGDQVTSRYHDDQDATGLPETVDIVTRVDCNNLGFERGSTVLWQVSTSGFISAGPKVAGQGEVLGSGFFESEPSEGERALLVSWQSFSLDPDVITEAEIALSRTFDLPATPSRLLFDYRVATSPAPGQLARRFAVSAARPGQAPLIDEEVYVENLVDDVFDSGPLTADIDLGSLAGGPALIRFSWKMPGPSAFPAQFQLDNVRIEGVPEPSAHVSIAAVLLSLAVLRRRRAGARSSRAAQGPRRAAGVLLAPGPGSRCECRR